MPNNFARSDKPSYKILVVEDDATGRELIKAKLARSGYIVTTVGSPEQAVAQVGMRHFDLVVVEIPPEHQRDVVSMVFQIKSALPTRPTMTPILAIAQVTPNGRVHTALLNMVEYYIMAPYHTVELVRTVQRALEAPRGSLST